MTDILFIVLSCISVVTAILVVTPKNPLYGALSLLVMIISLSVIFLQLSAPFLAIMQIVVYAGAVVVLFLFVIMLMNLDPVEMGEEKGFWFKVISFFLAAFMALFVVVAIFKSHDGLPRRFPPRAEATAVAEDETPIGINPNRPARILDTERGRLDVDFGSTDRVGSVLFDPYLVPFELISILIVIAVVGAVVLTKKDKQEA